MIDGITGVVAALGDRTVVISTGPFRLTAGVPETSVFCVGKEVSLATVLVWNPETGPSLYGFQDEAERQLFLLLTSCSGIGPRLGLALIGQLSAVACAQALAQGEAGLLSSVSGVGAKKADLLVLQLKKKALQLFKDGLFDTVPGNQSVHSWHEVIQALESLGYTSTEINRATAFLGENPPEDPSVPFLLKKALGFLRGSAK